MKMEFLERAKLENFVQRSARGDKLSLYSHAQLAQANAMIGPWLVAQAKRQIAERNSQDMSKGERPAVRGLLLNETHAQNGAAK